MAVTRTVLSRKGLIQSAHGATSQWESDNDANMALLDANVAFTSDLPTDTGFAASAGSALTLNVAAGIGFLNGALTSYAGGSLTLPASSTCYVYLDPGAGLQPAFNTTGFALGQIPIATVATGASAITTVTDKRSQFMQTFGQVAANKVLAGPTSGADAYPSPRALVAADIPVINASSLPSAAIQKVASSDLTAQGADVASTTLYAVPAAGAGLYRVSVSIIVTQAGTTSSTLPKVTITWTDQDNSTAQSFDLTASDTGNALTTLAQGDMLVSAGASTNISFSTSGYASSGATAMQFAVRLRVEAL